MTGKPKIMHDNRLDDATPVASLTDADPQFDVLNLRDWRPYTFWKPASLPATVTVDSGVLRAADYALIYGHDLHTAQAAVQLRGSTDNFAASDVPLRSSNLLRAPTDFSAAAWEKVGVTVSPNTHQDPDGFFSADTLVFASGASAVNQNFLFDQVLTGLTFSVGGWLRADSPTSINLAIGRQFNNPTVNLLCALTTDWQRFTLTHTFASTIESNVWFGINNFNDNAAHTIQAYGAQLQLGTAGYFEGIANGPLFLPFASASFRYWRLRFVQLTGAIMPTIAIAAFGEALALPEHLPSPYDPLGRELRGQANRSVAGHPLGKVIEFREFKRTIRLPMVSWSFVRDTWIPAWDAHLEGEPSVWAWDPDAHPEEIFLVQMGNGFATPHSGGQLADLEFDIMGVA